MTEYKTVGNQASDEFVEKRSRFIGYVCPVKTVEQANEFISKIKQKHWDAKHNVYAYILKDGNIKRYSDDGEPQGTAGVPVLDVLEKSGVVDTCVVVTRYFGGILLGGGGLVRAYSHSAKIALDAGEIITMSLCSLMCAECDYTFYGKLSLIIAQQGGTVINSDFTDKVKVEYTVKNELEENLTSAIFEASNGKVMPIKTGESFSKVF